MRTRVVAAVAVFLGLSVAARGESPGLAGTWSLKTDDMLIESNYAPNGTYTCRITRAGGEVKTVTGRYKLDGNQLEVALEGGKEPSRYTWRRVDADTLELADGAGHSTRMGRPAAQVPSPLSGEWVLKNDKLEFHLKLNPDGSFTRTTKTAAGEEKVGGTYKLSEGRLELRPEGGVVLPFRYRLADASNLELAGDDGSGLRLVRLGPPPPEPAPGPPAGRANPIFGPFYGPNPQPPPADRPMDDYMKEVRPDLAKLAKDASGHILFSHVESIKLPAAGAALPVAKTFIMTGEGKDPAPFIYPKGLDFVWYPSWSEDGKKVAFASNFQSARSAQYIDIFVADLAGGSVRRLTGVEAWAPVKGRGTLVVSVEADVEGQGAPATAGQINIAVQTCDGKLFKLQGQRKNTENARYPVFSCVIPDCPSGTIWVKAWSNRFIGDVATLVLPTGGEEECVLSLSGGNYGALQPHITPDGRYVVYVTEKTAFARVPETNWSDPKAPAPGVAHQGYSTLAVFDLQRGMPVAQWPGDKLGTAGDPKPSPDGQWIAFTKGIVRDENIAVCSLKGLLAGNPEARILVKNEWHTEQTPVATLGNCQPAWSPDGKRLAFIRYLLRGATAFTGNVFVVNADGTGLPAVTTLPPNTFPGWPTWSPDGKRIAFQLLTGKGKVFQFAEQSGTGIPVDIWSVRVDGTDLQQLTKDGVSGEPCWGP